MTTSTFFATPAAFRRWLEKHHATAKELSVGFYKRDSGIPSLTWPQSVDEALCFGWIDGVRNSIDGQRYRIRFTPRKPTSIWSKINIAKVKALTQAGLMTPAGLKAFEARQAKKSGVYSFEQGAPQKLPPDFASKLEANAKAWTYFTAQAPWYQRVAIHWVITAKKDETRAKRLASLIECSAAGRSIAPLKLRDAGPV